MPFRMITRLKDRFKARMDARKLRKAQQAAEEEARVSSAGTDRVLDISAPVLISHTNSLGVNSALPGLIPIQKDPLPEGTKDMAGEIGAEGGARAIAGVGGAGGGVGGVI